MRPHCSSPPGVRSSAASSCFAFTIGDGLCFAAGLVVLIAFWSNLTPIARVLIAMTTIVVDGFALAQYRAARIAQ